MKRLFIILFLGFFIQLKVFSQYFPVYSQYMMNGLAINPAYAGSRDVLSGTILYREQWVGFEGAPKIFSLGVHMPMKNEKVALGLIAYNRNVGIENSTGLFGNYAFRIRLGKGKLAFGLKGGFDYYTEQLDKISLHDPSSDAAYEGNKEHLFLPNFGFGMYFSNSNYFAGVSIPAFLNYNSRGKLANSGLGSYNMLLTGGYLFKISDVFKMKPSTLLKYKYQTSIQYDLNLNAIFFKNDLLWIGASYRNKESVVGLIEIQVSRKLRLGYSYDYSIGPLRGYNSGSHEVMIRYEWRDKIDTLNPLYF